MSRVYVHAWAQCCFHSFPSLSECAYSINGQLHGDKECPFSGITKSGRVWRKVLESSAQSVPGVTGHGEKLTHQLGRSLQRVSLGLPLYRLCPVTAR